MRMTACNDRVPLIHRTRREQFGSLLDRLEQLALAYEHRVRLHPALLLLIALPFLGRRRTSRR